jgi:hypothetical protein
MTSWRRIILISCGGCNRSPQTWWLKGMGMAQVVEYLSRKYESMGLIPRKMEAAVQFWNSPIPFMEKNQTQIHLLQK